MIDMAEAKNLEFQAGPGEDLVQSKMPSPA